MSAVEAIEKAKRLKTGPKPKPIQERFWKFVSPEPMSGCWLWAGAYHNLGYGRIGTGQRSALGNYLGAQAHRVSYEMHRGAIPDGLELDHLCRNHCCVNPDHLEPVTHAVNMARAVHKKVRRGSTSKTHCNRGHPLSGENLYVAAKAGSRSCKACRKISSDAARQRSREKKNAAG